MIIIMIPITAPAAAMIISTNIFIIIAKEKAINNKKANK